MDQYLTVIVDQPTGLFRGAVFGNAPSPSGATRYRCMERSTTIRATPAEAMEDIAFIHPTLPRSSTAGLDLPEHLLPSRGTNICVVRPKGAREESFVETRAPASSAWIASDLTPDQVGTLLLRGVIEMESSSDNDPDLSAIYDNYVVVKELAEMARPGQ